MLGALTVPLSWGVAVPPDGYDHWAPESEEGAEAEAKTAEELKSDESAEGTDEWSEWEQWNQWEGEAEPRFEVPRSSGVVPHSPAAG
jgi:hypothetical protein